MQYKNIGSLINRIKNYVSPYDSNRLPLFINTDSRGDYLQLKDNLSTILMITTVSSYCETDDSIPSIEILFSKMRKADKSFLLLGFSIHAKMLSNKDRNTCIDTLKNLSLQNGKLVVLCFQFQEQLKALVQNDQRLNNRILFLQGNSDARITVTFINPSISIYNMKDIIVGYKAFLKSQEMSCNLESQVQSKIYNYDYLQPSVTVQRIDSTYKIIASIDQGKTSNLEECLGTEEQWQFLLRQLLKFETIECVMLQTFGDNSNYASLIHKWNEWDSLQKWMYFLAIRAFEAHDTYICGAAILAESTESFVKNIYRNLLDIEHTSKNFDRLYKERKILIENISDISNAIAFCQFAQIEGNDAIYYYTDVSTCEKQAIIACLAQIESIDEKTEKVIRLVYPNLGKYLNQFYFGNSLYDSYFQMYKYQKISNKIHPEFLETINQQAKERVFNRLPSRNSVFENIDKAEASIYFIDALGVEFLGYITTLCSELGLDTKVSICRANLPTTTYYNKDFLKGLLYYDIKDLDELKHSGEGDFNYTLTKLPLHIIEELRIIKDIITENIVTKLTDHKKVIIVSDHGASRLVVLNEQQYSFDVQSNGTHGGRCCLYDDSLPQVDYATVENGQYVLASYDRFKGGRAARVETHGGATLEEVIVPIIEISRADKNIEIKLLNDVILVGFRKKAVIEVFATKKLENVVAKIDEKYYSATNEHNTTYMIPIEDIKRAGDYEAEIFSGSNIVGKLTFKIKKEISSDDKFGLSL